MQWACVADSRLGLVGGCCEHSVCSGLVWLAQDRDRCRDVVNTVCSGLVWLTQEWDGWREVVNTVYAVGLCGWLKNGTGGGNL